LRLSPASNQFVIDTMGADHTVFGSDYPYDIGDPEGRGSVPVIDALPAAARDKIYRCGRCACSRHKNRGLGTAVAGLAQCWWWRCTAAARMGNSLPS
jgi:hypothetical protein